MPNPYPIELRRRALDAYDRGEGTIAEVARMFQVSTASLTRWRAQERRGDGLAPKAHSGGRAHQKIFEEHREAMRQWLAQEPDLYLVEIAQRIHQTFDIHIDPSQLSRILKDMGLVLKKNLS